MDFLLEGILAITPQQLVMYVVGILLIWLAVKKEYEPALLLPMGFGAILVNLPLSGVIDQVMPGIGETHGVIEWLFQTTIEASEALPILLFIGIGAMIDFWPASFAACYVFIRCRRTVWHLLCHLRSDINGIRFKGCGFHRYHRCCRRSYIYSGITDNAFRLCRSDSGCGLFLYGSCADYPAVCHPSCNNEKRTSDSYDIQPEGGFKVNEDCFPDYRYHHCRPYLTGIRGSGGLPDVW